MSSVQVLLILLSGLGVLHGILLGFFLWFYPKGSHISNRLLSLLLLVLSFRIGKSVILEFVDGVYYTLIFIGLAALLLIGPLFYLYTRSVLDKSFKLGKAVLLHLIPFVPAIIFASWVNHENIKTTPVPVFVILFCFYYGHYLLYLILSFWLIRAAKKNEDDNQASIRWLSVMTYALAAIWMVYVLNLVEEKIPYVVGPILYSFVAYGVSFLAFKKGYLNLLENTKYKTTPLSHIEIDVVFEKLQELIIGKQLYKDPDLSLSLLSGLLKMSPQKISMAINIKFKSNFNGFINHYRVKEAVVLLRDEEFKNYTIAFIAFETGFNSLTSFNAAFKRETNKTPSAFRKEIITA